MHQYSALYYFTNADDNRTVVTFGPGDRLRVWRSWLPGPAHELLAAYNGCCLHSPGPGDAFRQGDLETSLRSAVFVQVVSRADTLEEMQRRIGRAVQIVGVPWNLLFSNCQDCLSWIVTGEAKSFQRDAAVGATIGIGFLVLFTAVVNTPSQPRRRRGTRRLT
jgi:hypothetical protein